MTVGVWADSIQDKFSGRVQPNKTFTVYTDNAATTLAIIYTDATGETIISDSSVTSDAEGNAIVYASPALLWGKVAGQSFTFPVPVGGTRSVSSDGTVPAVIYLAADADVPGGTVTGTLIVRPS